MHGLRHIKKCGWESVQRTALVLAGDLYPARVSGDELALRHICDLYTVGTVPRFPVQRVDRSPSFSNS